MLECSSLSCEWFSKGTGTEDKPGHMGWTRGRHRRIHNVQHSIHCMRQYGTIWERKCSREITRRTPIIHSILQLHGYEKGYIQTSIHEYIALQCYIIILEVNIIQ